MVHTHVHTITRAKHIILLITGTEDDAGNLGITQCCGHRAGRLFFYGVINIDLVVRPGNCRRLNVNFLEKT